MMNAEPTPALPNWLADPALRPLWTAACDRMTRTGRQARGTVTVRGLDHAGRRALGGLLGVPVVRPQARVHLAVLDADLRHRAGLGLLDVVERLVGPVRDAPGERAAREAARETPLVAARAWLEARPWLARQPWIDPWLDGIRRDGLVLAMQLGESDVRSALEVLCAILSPDAEEPGSSSRCVGEGERDDVADGVGDRVWPLQSRVQLAANVLHDAHALDTRRGLSRLVLRGLAAACGESVPGEAAGRRALWERFGVVPDLVSRTCLVLGLAPESGGACSAPGPARRQDGASIDRWHDAGRVGAPVHVTGWDLRAHAGRWHALGEAPGVLVCENPRVLEAIAERHGASFPVLCTGGQPGAVVMDLLARLGDAGVTLHFHGDLDTGGVIIANRLVRALDVRLWRMRAADYEEALVSGLPRLAGEVPDAIWDGELAPAMRRAGVAVHEEVVLPSLLDALPALLMPGDVAEGSL